MSRGSDGGLEGGAGPRAVTSRARGTTQPVESTDAAPTKPTLGLFVLAGASLLTSIGVSVLNVALADLARDLHASTSDLQWIINAYSLTFAGLMLMAMSVGDRFGRVRVFRVGLVVTLLMSVVAAFVDSPGALIGCRVVMGAAAALVMPVSMAIVGDLYTEPAERARAFGAFVAAGAFGFVLGPIVGGLLLEHFWWGSTFLLNVPVVLLLLVLGRRCLPETPGRRGAGFDPGGMVLSTLGVSLITWALVEAPDRGWLSGVTILAIVAGLAVLTVFVWWERRREHPMLDVSYLKDPRVSGTIGAFATIGFVFGGLLLAVSLLLRTVLEHGPLATGLYLAPMALASLVASMASARITERIGTSRALAVGLIGVLAACVILAVTDAAAGQIGGILASTVLFGLGFGVASAPATTAVLDAIPHEDAGLASGLNVLSRQIAQIFGVAVLGSILSSTYRGELDVLTSRLDLAPEPAALSRESIGAALVVADDIGGATGRDLAHAAADAFAVATKRVGLAGAFVAALGVLLMVWARRRPGATWAEPRQVESDESNRRA